MAKKPTLHKASDGKYHAYVWIKGKQHHCRTGCTSLRKAQEALDEYIDKKTDARKAMTEQAESLLLGDVNDRYMRLVGSKHVDADGTALMGKHVVDHPDDKNIPRGFFRRSQDMRDIAHQDVLELSAWRAQHTIGKGANKRPIKPATVNDTVERLKKLFTFAKRSGAFFPKEPDWNGARMTGSSLWLVVPKTHVREFTEEESEAIDTYTETKRTDLEALIRFMRHTVKRKTNCFTLKWTQVHEKRGVIEMIGKHNTIITIEIDEEIKEILDMVRGQDKIFVFTRQSQRTFDKVIKGKRYTEVKGDRHQWNKDSLRRAWGTLRKATGLTGEASARMHDFRHDFASKALRAGDDAATIKAVADNLNHAKIETTLNTYGHLIKGGATDLRNKVTEARRAARVQARRKALKDVNDPGQAKG